VNESSVPSHDQDDYRTLADAIPQIVWSAHADGSIEYFNRAWYRYTGLSERASLADGWSRIVHRDDIERVVARWKLSIATGQPHEVEFRMLAPGGTYRWFVGRAQAVLGDGGIVTKWYGGCTDIDDLKRAEAALRENAATFRRLANSLPQIVWIADANGKNTFLNHRWHDYTGIPQARPHDLSEAMHPDDYARTIAIWQAAIGTGSTFETEFRLRRVDDVYRWFLVRAVPVRGADDAIVEWFGSCTDVDDKKRAEAEVRAALERERRTATTLQRAFLTHRMPEIDGFTFDAVYRPAERDEVGGDWYDAIALDDGRIVVSIGDVAGHGLDAAVVMGNVRQAIRVVAQVADHDPVAMLDTIDRTLTRESPDTIVTAFIGIIDPARGTLTFASAGHPPPLLCSHSTVSELAARGLPLGLRAAAASAPATTVPLPAMGLLVLYTDGLVEATRDLEEGERRLREASVRVALEGAEHPAEAIQTSVLHNGAQDDVAVLTVAFTAQSASRRVA